MEHLRHDVGEKQSPQTEVKRVRHCDRALVHVHVLVQSAILLSELCPWEAVDVPDQELGDFDGE